MPSWPGQRQRRRLHNSYFNPRRQVGSPIREPASGQPRCRGWGVTRWSPGWPGCALLPQRSAFRSVNSQGGWRPSGQRGEEGGRRGTRCLFGSLWGLGSPGVRGRGHPVGCGAGRPRPPGASAARGGGEGEGSRAKGGRETPGKEPPAPSSHHYEAAFLRMALPRGAPRGESAPQTPGRQPAL